MNLLIVLTLAASLSSDNYERANAFFKQQRFREAGEALDIAIREDPTFVPAWTLRGKIALAFDQFDIARAAFLRAVALNPRSPNAQFMLGFFYYVDNDFSKALPALQSASQLNPNDPRALLYLALSEEGLAHVNQAEALYRKTIELETKRDQANPETHTAYGRLLFTLSRNEESRQQVALVLQLDPHSRDGHYESGRLAFARGDFETAASEGERALKETGSGTLDRQIHFLLTRAYYKLGKSAPAESNRKLFEASPPTLRR